MAARVLAIAERLTVEGCGLLVVACNTASSAALEALRTRLAVPVVGMEPPLKPAVAGSARRHVAVLVTPATARGARLARLAEAHAEGARVETVPMPGLADLVERGAVDGPEVERALRDALEGPLQRGIDAVALGCTHYGFLRPALARLLPPGVRALDAAEPVARRALQLLAQQGRPPPAGDVAVEAPAEVAVATTGDPGALARTIERLQQAGADLPPLALAGEPFPLAGVAA